MIGHVNSQNISNLKSFVSSLENESLAKQLELQQVVGSKYHDFIQSGQNIERMHEQASKIEYISSNFLNYEKVLSNNTKCVLSNAVSSASIDDYSNSWTRGRELHVSSWNSLENCDLLVPAANIVFVAAIMQLLGFNVPGNIRTIVIESDKMKNVMISPECFDDFMKTFSLLENVISDAHLILTDPSVHYFDRSLALACIGILSTKSDNELLESYLIAAGMKLNLVLDTEDHLLAAVNVLQQIIFDVFYIFQNKSINLSNSVPLPSSLLESKGLIFKHASVLLKSFPGISEQIETDFDSFYTDALNPESLRYLDSWIQSIAIKVSDFSNKKLSMQTDASDVAKLQHLVWHACVNFTGNVPATVTSYGTHLNSLTDFTQEQFNIASEYMLNPKFRSRSRNDKKNEKGAFLNVWNLFFEGAFHTQVLKVLRLTCQSSVNTVNSKIFLIMRKCGLAVDHQSFSITFPQISTASEWFDQRSSKSLFLSVSTASCGLIHRMANIVLATIESELTLLFSAVQFSVQNNRSSTEIVSYGLFIEANYLLASLSILLRSIGSTLVSELKSYSETESLKRKRSASILIGLLTIARIAWLLRYDNGVIRDLFDKAEFSLMHVPVSGLSYSDYQIKSAFEIADTNGDGLLTYFEYVDALQALGITNDMQLLEVTKSKLHSISQTEFSMLCAHFTTGNTRNIIDRLNFCMENLSIYLHISWVDFISNSFCAPLFTNILEQFKPLVSVTTGNLFMVAKNTATPTKSFKLPSEVSIDLLRYLFKTSHYFYTSMLSIDTALIPSCIRAEQNDFTTNTSQITDNYFHHLISLSQIKSLIPQSHNELISMLRAAFIYHIMTYANKLLKEVQSMAVLNNELDAIDEEACLQIILDLTFCEFVVKTASNHSFMAYYDYSTLLISIRAKISQMRTQLTNPPVDYSPDEYTTKICQKTYYLLTVIFSGPLKLIATESSPATAGSYNHSSNNLNTSSVHGSPTGGVGIQVDSYFAPTSYQRLKSLPVSIKSGRG